MTTEKDILIFSTHFQCKCGGFVDINRFIKTQINPGVIELLCPICEKRYKISLNYEEIK